MFRFAYVSHSKRRPSSNPEREMLTNDKYLKKSELRPPFSLSNSEKKDKKSSKAWRNWYGARQRDCGPLNVL